MGGEWIFSFKHQNRDSLDVAKYQQLLQKLRQEYESEFSMMSSSEGSIRWANVTGANGPVNNIFAKFHYYCVKEHIIRGSGHGTWTLYWDPTLFNAKNDIHARCAPMFFKDISNQIQSKLVEAFPEHFSVTWKNGLSGYEGYDNGSYATTYQYLDEAEGDVLRQMLVAMKWNDSDSDDGERCIHHIPWSYCSECSDDILEMHGF